MTPSHLTVQLQQQMMMIASLELKLYSNNSSSSLKIFLTQNHTDWNHFLGNRPSLFPLLYSASSSLNRHCLSWCSSLRQTQKWSCNRDLESYCTISVLMFNQILTLRYRMSHQVLVHTLTRMKNLKKCHQCLLLKVKWL